MSESKKIKTALISVYHKDGLDAIFLCPVSRDAITPALEELKEADVKIINIDTEVKDTDYIDAFIGSDNKAAGHGCTHRGRLP